MAISWGFTVLDADREAVGRGRGHKYGYPAKGRRHPSAHPTNHAALPAYCLTFGSLASVPRGFLAARCLAPAACSTLKKKGFFGPASSA